MITTEQNLKTYFDMVQTLAPKSLFDAAAKEELSGLIELLLEEYVNKPPYSHFFQAEQAFYQGLYDLSGQRYLLCEGMSDLSFYSCRSSAMAAYAAHDYKRARQLIEQALEIRPDDTFLPVVLTQVPLEQTQEKCEEAPMTLETVQENNTCTDMAEEACCAMPRMEEKCCKPSGLFSPAEESLDKKIKTHMRGQADRLLAYVEAHKNTSRKQEAAIYMLSGWKKEDNQTMNGKATSGFFVRCNGKGIAVNPGHNFLHHLHAQGLSIKDIDYVIATRPDHDSYAEIRDIYALNNQINKINPELQIIHYYLNNKAFQELAPVLKPHFKQERNSVHQMEIFIDSPEMEMIELAPSLTLNYFAMQDMMHQQAASPLGIRIDAKMAGKTIRIGYVSGAKWTPLLSHHLGSCDMLMTGFGNTSPSDYGRTKYNEESLGYYGTYSLLEEVTPSLLLCMEFGGREGDIRLEIVRKMRADLANHHPNMRNKPVILPADQGLKIDLNELKVECSITKQKVEPCDVKVIRTSEGYSSLNYLAQDNCL